jgi:predicted TIM-barrel fold metal-dependent hydrolase
MARTINRRQFCANSAISAAGLIIGAGILDSEAESSMPYSSYRIMEEAGKFRKIDCHMHINLAPDSGPEVQIDIADRLGIEKLVASLPVTLPDRPFRDYVDNNDIILKAMKQYPDRFIGQFTVNPVYAKESLDEIKRCTDNGMSGIKLYYEVKISNPLYYPIIEKMIDLKMVILMHSYSGLGRGGYRTKYGNLYPNESTPEDFRDIAARYPEAILQFAHIGAGGDWQYECKVLKDYPNVSVDVAGSNNEENMINYAISYLGEDRLLFASDNSYYQSIGKILSADVTDNQRKKIFFDNYNNLLKKGGFNVA